MDVLFLDANVLFSAAYRPDAGLRRLWTLTEARLVTSLYAVEEANRNLELPAQREALDALLKEVEVVNFEPDEGNRLGETGLPNKDKPILQAALHVGATHLLTGDVKHFGHHFGERFEGVLVLPPAAYLRIRERGMG